MNDTYTCENCGETFAKGRSDEEAAAEANELWTPEELTDVAVICDDCFKAMMAWKTPEQYRADA